MLELKWIGMEVEIEVRVNVRSIERERERNEMERELLIEISDRNHIKIAEVINSMEVWMLIHH